MAKRPPRWYFSLRSPYSWFAYRDLTERFPDVADAVEWVPFWEPDPVTQAALDEIDVVLPIVAMSRAKNFYILQDTRRLAQARGWQMTWPIDRDPCWEIAHLAYLRAQDAGLGREYVDRVYRARWQDSLDITDRAVIATIGSAVGLADLGDACDDPELRARGVACLEESYKDGLFGVPFFTHGRDRYFGVDRLAAFVTAVRASACGESGRPSWTEMAALAFSTPLADSGPAGGCG
jgi:2-hydroxychromene-2-carboxylate isomerase